MPEKKCPHCEQSISLESLKLSGSDKAYIKREAFACPHCGALIQLPAKAEKILSIGLLFSVILAPLSYYWLAAQILSYIIFIFGGVLIVIGMSTNQLIKAKEPANSTTANHNQATEEKTHEGNDHE